MKSKEKHELIFWSQGHFNLPVFDGDPCAWPNWYGMFKALVDDQQLSKTQKMIYLKASDKGTAEKAIAGIFFDGTMYDKAIAELTQRFGKPTLISKSLINKFLEIPAVHYGHEADLRAAANMQQVITKLPPKIAVRWSRRKFELQPKDVDLKDLDEWLETEVQVQNMAFGCASTKENPEKEKPKLNLNKSKWFKKKKDVRNDTHANSGAKLECFVCKGEHALTSCETWKRLTVNERWQLAKKLGLCFRCLKRGHLVERCSLQGTCPAEGCVRRHHPQLHAAIEPPQLNSSAETFHPLKGETSATDTPTNHTTCGVTKEAESIPRPGRVALQMIQVIMGGENGIRIRANAFLDGGSGSSYLKEEIADTLGLGAERKPLRVAVFGATSIMTDSKTVTVCLESMDGSVKKRVFLWTTSKICEMTAVDWSPNARKLDHLRDLEVRKPVEHVEVGVLIGSDYYKELLLPLEHRIGKPGEPVWVKTPLGWTIVGHVSETANACSIANCVYTFHTTFTPEMRADELMRKMWDEEVVGITNQNKPLTAEEVLAARKVAESRCYADGRYKVAIPWKDDEPLLHCNRTTAEDRLYSLEKHLQRRPDVAEKYCQVMEANKAKGYIRKLEPGEIDDGPSWYLPHFPVVREDKETTKVRIVYDSAARYGGVSLNDTMVPGPKLQQDVFDVLLRFRSNPVALVADLTEMFSQVTMAKQDRRYHRFLWRGLDLSKPPEVYEAMRLMFGDRASPYLAQYVFRQHAEDNRDDYPLAAAIILSQMYMDDIITSLETDDEGRQGRQAGRQGRLQDTALV